MVKRFLAGVFVGLILSVLALVAQQAAGQGAQPRASDKVVEPQVLVDNPKVKIVRCVLKPGEGTPVHTHTLDHVSVVIHGSSIRDVQANGTTSEQDQKAGEARFIPGTGRTYSFANAGLDSFESVAIELK